MLSPPWTSNLEAHPAEFGLTSPHYHASQFPNINPILSFHYVCVCGSLLIYSPVIISEDIFFSLFYVCGYFAFIYVYEAHIFKVLRDQKKSDPPGQELQIRHMWISVIESKSSGKGASVLDCWTLPPTPSRESYLTETWKADTEGNYSCGQLNCEGEATNWKWNHEKC